MHKTTEKKIIRDVLSCVIKIFPGYDVIKQIILNIQIPATVIVV